MRINVQRGAPSFLEELIGPDLQGQGETLEVVERNVAGLTFNVSDKGPMQPRLESQCFLRPTPQSA